MTRYRSLASSVQENIHYTTTHYRCLYDRLSLPIRLWPIMHHGHHQYVIMRHLPRENMTHASGLSSCNTFKSFHRFTPKTRRQAVAKMSRLYHLYPVTKRKRLPRVTTVTMLWWRCYIDRYTINARIRYSNSEHVVDDCKQNLCIQNVKPLHIYIYIYRQLLMISYRLVIVLSNGTIPDPLRRTV